MPATRSPQEIRADLSVAQREYDELSALAGAGKVEAAEVDQLLALAERLKALDQELAELEAGTQ